MVVIGESGEHGSSNWTSSAILIKLELTLSGEEGEEVEEEEGEEGAGEELLYASDSSRAPLQGAGSPLRRLPALSAAVRRETSSQLLLNCGSKISSKCALGNELQRQICLLNLVLTAPPVARAHRASQ
ncbi:hypothetical protein AOLI_G00063680 [Acnodon oligacanthus]